MKTIISILLALFPSIAYAQAHYHSQIHNAPGWQPSHSYTYSPGPPNGHFTRVVAGAGWTPAGGTSGRWNSGQLLNAYQLASQGTCTSASSGSGPSGTGSAIADGTCTWKYLSVVDYVSFTGWALDSGLVWASGTDYGARDVVNSGVDSSAYQQLAAGCHSTVQPTGTAAEITTADGCIWDYLGTIYYSSRTHPFRLERFLHDTFQGYIAPATLTATASVSSGTTLTVTAVNSGILFPGLTISGAGISNERIRNQISGTTGGVGVYQLSNAAPDASPATITGSYGALTITTPPRAHALSSAGSDIVSAIDLSNPGRAGGGYGGYGQAGATIAAGSGTSLAILVPQTLGSAARPITFFHTLISDVEILNNNIFHADLWNDSEYVTGQCIANTACEHAPLITWSHNYAYNDTVQGWGWHTPSPASTFSGQFGFNFYIEAAPGESFADTFAANPELPLSGYSANNGVAIRGVGVAGLQSYDNVVVFRRLQVTTDKATPIVAPLRACNACIFDHDLLQGGTGGRIPPILDAVTNCGANCYWHNNLIIAKGTYGIAADYGAYVYNNTIVCPSGTCWSAMDNTWDWDAYDGMTMSGNAVFGFHHFTSANYYYAGFSGDCTWNCATVQGTNNATDLPDVEGADFPAQHKGVDYALPFYTGSNMPSPPASSAKPICGYKTAMSLVVAGVCEALRGVSRSAAFVSWPNNLRINPAGPLVGAGAAFSYCDGLRGWGGAGANGIVLCKLGAQAQVNSPDLFGTLRPQNGRYDIGAVELFGGK